MTSPRGDLANYGPRAAAALLDALVLVVAIAVAAAAAGVEPRDAQPYVIVGALLGSLLYATPLMSRSGAHNGQTLGKQALGIRVVRQDAAAVSPGTALLRDFVGKGLLGLIPFFSIVDYLFPLSDARRQAIHDKLASTFVVRADAVPDLRPAESTALEGPFRPPV